MGGCKCTFYNCGLTTGTSKHLYADRETHFFHFPIRDRERCIEWAIYSNNMPFLELPVSKIRNKVICDFHFKENNFMNYKRERLTKTVAVPTIYIEPETKLEVDLLENPTDWVRENKEKALSTTYAQSEDINMEEYSQSDSIVEQLSEVVEQPVFKKMKVEPVVKILNGNGNFRGEVSCQQVVKKLSTLKQNSPMVVKISPESFTIRKIVKPEKSTNVQIIKPQIVETPQETDDSFETVETTVVTSKPTVTVTKASVNEELKPICEESLRQIAEIKEMLSKSQMDTSSSSRKDSEDTNISHSQLNKVQLFNGIKRYLSPAITALLRMELFAAPGREYKKDEKIICQELLLLGEKPYSFIHDEWRLRLPAKTDVQQWLDEKAVEEDDDAS